MNCWVSIKAVATVGKMLRSLPPRVVGAPDRGALQYCHDSL